MTFPRKIQLEKHTLTLCEKDECFSGLNLKKKYQDEEGAFYLLKMEKTRGLEVFQGLFRSFKPDTRKLQQHLNLLRDEATAMTVIASHIAKKLFNFVEVPENYLARLSDGTPVIFSKLIPKENLFTEFLKSTKSVQEKKTTHWEMFPRAKELNLTKHQAYLLGQIYYVALLMGHWDIINNIDLTNSGSVLVNGKLKACIVDWGNCPQGFGGLSQDATAFKNPEFKGLKLKTGNDAATGFVGCVPFDGVVYPRLPRQVVLDLFNLTGTDDLHKKMLAGFRMAHSETITSFSKKLISDAIREALKSVAAQSFRPCLNQDWYGNKNGLAEIMAKRLDSLKEIIQLIDQGKTMAQIAELQFAKICRKARI